MFIMGNHHGGKCLSILLQLITCNDMLKVFSDKMAQWYEMIYTFLITINFCNARKLVVH